MVKGLDRGPSRSEVVEWEEGLGGGIADPFSNDLKMLALVMDLASS